MFVTLVTPLWFLTWNCGFLNTASQAFPYAHLILNYGYAGDDGIQISG